MDSLAAEKSDKNVLILATSGWYRLHFFTLFLASLLMLDSQIRARLGEQSLFLAKGAFALAHFWDIACSGAWLMNLDFLIPFAGVAAGFIMIGLSRTVAFDRVSNRMMVGRDFYFVSFRRRIIPFETLAGILLGRSKDRSGDCVLAIEDSLGKNIFIEKSRDKDKLRGIAKKIQELSLLPFHQKFYP